jgi:hypothetical protein
VTGPRRVVVTAIVRMAKPDEVSANLRVLDLESGRVTFVTPVPESVWRADDPNPRGGVRGARGVSVHGGRLVLANSERLFLFDTSWRLTRQITHPLMGGVHDILAEERGIWLTCAACDVLLLVSWDGGLEDWWTLRDHPQLVRELGLQPQPGLELTLDYRDPRLVPDSAFNRIHLNGVARGPDGLLLSFGRFLPVEKRLFRRPRPVLPGTSALVRLDEREGIRSAPATVLHRADGAASPNHNAAWDGDLLVYNDSTEDRLVAVDRSTGGERASVAVPGGPAFARGLAPAGPGRWLVGSQAPAAVHLVDLEHGEVEATFPLDGHENETVYAIAELPDEFDDPVVPADDDPYAFWLVQPDGG